MASRERILTALNHRELDRVPVDLGGGFVFQQVHNILANVPPENIIAMYDAVREYDARARR